MAGCPPSSIRPMRSLLLWSCGRPNGLSSSRPRLPSCGASWGSTAGTRQSRPRRTRRSPNRLPSRCGARAGASRAGNRGIRSTLALFADPNERQRHEPGPCVGCGASWWMHPRSGWSDGRCFATDDGAGRRTPAHRPPLWVRNHQLRHRAAGRGGAGAVRSYASPNGGWRRGRMAYGGGQ
jgi:hypothetical protein